jgi:CdiI immunity protein
MTDRKFPKLRNLLGGYFHQDWKSDYDWQGNQPNFEEVIQFYKTVNPKNTVSQATNELREFLDLPLDELDLKNALQDVGVFYSPKTRKMTYKQWLESILTILEKVSLDTSYLKEVEKVTWVGWEKYADE